MVGTSLALRLLIDLRQPETLNLWGDRAEILQIFQRLRGRHLSLGYVSRQPSLRISSRVDSTKSLRSWPACRKSWRSRTSRRPSPAFSQCSLTNTPPTSSSSAAAGALVQAHPSSP